MERDYRVDIGVIWGIMENKMETTIMGYMGIVGYMGLYIRKLPN